MHLQSTIGEITKPSTIFKESGESGMTPSLNHSDNLFVANLQSVSLEKLVKSKLEVLFQQQKEAQVELNGLYNIVLEQVEKPLIELALLSHNGNQVRTAQMLGINRNTLKKKIDNYKIRVRRSN
jgi:Fis family transcriptional regulator, factor for inversion stimulation protein